MEFWGVEVKPGETLKVNPGEGKYLHLSQSSLGEVKKEKGADNVPTFVKFGDQKLVLGTLSADKFPQIQYDLVFEKEFELSHDSKNASVFFCGYTTASVEEEDGFDQFSDDSDEFESDEDVPEAVPIVKNENGKPAAKVEEPKVQNALKENAAAKSKPQLKESAKVDKPKFQAEDDDEDDDDEDDEDDDSEDDESDDDEEIVEGEDDSDDEDDEDDSSDEDEDEETPKKVQVGNKRPLGSASKTPVADKKAKIVSPADQKAGGSSKKQGHPATPHPAKGGKTPANDKSKPQTPKSAGSVTCKSCSKSFNSENALESHTKAKHAAK